MKNPLIKLWLIGAGGGLIFGVSYWFLWGCRSCAKAQSPYTIVAFCIVVGAILGRTWGKDHLPSN